MHENVFYRPPVSSLELRASAGDVSYLDPRSGATYPLSTPRWCGDNQAPLLLTPLPGITRAEIRSDVRSLWRYGAALPFVPEDPITMGEGCTPLVPREIAGCKALLKCEWFMPTGESMPGSPRALWSTIWRRFHPFTCCACRAAQVASRTVARLSCCRC